MTAVIRKIISIISITAVCLTLFSSSAYAKTGSITLDTTDSSTNLPVNGIAFSLYKIADYNDGSFSFTRDFSDSGMAIGDLSDPYFSVHLMHYADKINTSCINGVSADNMPVVFSALSPGAYLIVSSAAPEGYIIPSPMTITIPCYDTVAEKWIYDITAKPKLSSSKDETGELIYISAKKHWSGDASHPDSVSVTLLKDNTPVETVILNEANGWYYRWDKLNMNSSWSVVEDSVPEGYLVSYSASQMSVVLKNTYSPSIEESTAPIGEETSSEEYTEPTTKPDELIDTGQLNWPVPVFAISGLLLFSIGWAILNLSRKEEDSI